MATDERTHSWIDNNYDRTGSGATITLMDPWSGASLPPIVGGGQGLVDKAVQSSAAAFRKHRAVTIAERSEWLSAAAGAIVAITDKLVELTIADIGKPRKAAQFEVGRSAAFIQACSRAIHDFNGEVLPLDSAKNGAGLFGFTKRVPYGVVAAVTPFNAPANLLVQKLAPALVTGNAVVVKPSPEGTRVALLIAECFARAGLPSGLLNVIPGGKEEALGLAAHPLTSVVTLTGGTSAGKELAAAAGLKPFLSELGGNSANIVCADANLADAASRIAASAFEASGQQCISAQRVIVETEVYDRFLELFVAASRKLRVGDPNLMETEVGPVVSKRAADRISGMIATAQESGAKVVCGPERSGCCLSPTIIVDAPEDSSIVCEEIFGPVAVVMRARDFNHAVELANQSVYGLQASCFTNQLDKAMSILDALNVGSVWINEGSRFRLDNYPFGGFGMSGNGREGVRYAMEEYTQWKFAGMRMAR